MTPTLKDKKDFQIIQKKIAKISLQLLEEKYADERKQNQHLNNLFERLHLDLKFFQQDLKESSNATGNTLSDYRRIYLELLDTQRKLLAEMKSWF